MEEPRWVIDLVRRLYDCGVSAEEISSALELEIDVVLAMIEETGGDAARPVHFVGNDHYLRYRHLWKGYANVSIAFNASTTSASEVLFLKTVATILRIPEIQQIMMSMEYMYMAADPFSSRGLLPFYQSYEKLLREMFRIPQEKPGVARERIWKKFMHACAHNELFSLPSSHENTLMEIAHLFLNERLDQPLLNQAARTIIATQLLRTMDAILSDRERRIIEARFIYTGKQPSYREIGQQFGGVSSTRATQLINRALRKIRKCLAYDPYIKLLMQPAGQRIDDTLNVLSRMETDSPFVQTLRTPINEIGMSVRLYNLLLANGCTMLADMVQVNEHAWRMTRGMGKKALQELKDIVDRYGLSLGMAIDYVTLIALK